MQNMDITPVQSTTFISPIRPLNLEELGQNTKTEVAGKEGISVFKGIFEEAVNNVRTTEEDLVKNQYLLATGEIDDPHTVGIASSKAQLAVDMLVYMRSKALESYNEIMRISL